MCGLSVFAAAEQVVSRWRDRIHSVEPLAGVSLPEPEGERFGLAHLLDLDHRPLLAVKPTQGRLIDPGIVADVNRGVQAWGKGPPAAQCWVIGGLFASASIKYLKVFVSELEDGHLNRHDRWNTGKLDFGAPADKSGKKDGVVASLQVGRELDLAVSLIYGQDMMPVAVVSGINPAINGLGTRAGSEADGSTKNKCA